MQLKSMRQLAKIIALLALTAPAWTAGAVAPMIATGYSSCVFLNADGTVWGTGNVTNYWPGATSPVPLLQLPNIVAVATGDTDFAVLADGTLWGSGYNSNGQLGDGSTQYRSQPQQVPGLSGVVAVAAWNHVLALKADGTVWGLGTNGNGQLGNGTRTDQHFPVQAIGLTGIVKIAVGADSSIALKNDGTVWVWGTTCCGALGNGVNTQNESDPTEHTLVPTQVPNLDQVVAITTGESHNMALRADGTVWTWGIGANGENGTGDLSSRLVPTQIQGLSNVVAIEAKGIRFSLALKADGTVWVWGNNNAGQFGQSGIVSSDTPVQVPGVTGVVAISAGWDHVIAMRNDGTVVAWGLNANGQLGDNTLTSNSQPLPVAGPGGTCRRASKMTQVCATNDYPGAQAALRDAACELV